MCVAQNCIVIYKNISSSHCLFLRLFIYFTYSCFCELCSLEILIVVASVALSTLFSQPPQSLLEKRKKSSDRFMLLYIGVAFFSAVAVAVAAAMLLLPTLITTDQIAWRSGQVESYLCAGCRLSFAYIYATSLYIYIYTYLYKAFFLWKQLHKM